MGLQDQSRVAEQDAQAAVEPELNHSIISIKGEDVRHIFRWNALLPPREERIEHGLDDTCVLLDSNPGPAPDGGLTACIQAVVAHIVLFNTWGYINSYGVFQTYYENAFHHPPSDISWIGSVQVFLLFFIGTFSGRATDAGYFLPVMLGAAYSFARPIPLLSQYFVRNRAVAFGFAAVGSASGGLVFPAIVETLLPKLGFPWTVRVIGFVILALQIVAVVSVRTRLPPRTTGPLLELSAFTELPYTLFTIGMFLAFLGLYFAFYYIGVFGKDLLGISQADSVNLLLVMNGYHSIIGFACLTATPIAGWLIQKDKGRYFGAQVFAGTTLVGGFATLVAARIALTGWKRKAKV